MDMNKKHKEKLLDFVLSWSFPTITDKLIFLVCMESTTLHANMGSNRSKKERLHWTKELHDQFIDAINQLGGPDRATPKGILKTMGVSNSVLRIQHVKSHLQKYRISNYILESTNRSKFGRRTISDILPNFSATCADQLKEALQIQMESQRRQSDHLESLKLKIEAQARYLEGNTEEERSQTNVYKPSKSFSSKPMPSLCEESKSNTKEAESDSEMFRALKRPRMEGDEFSPGSETHLDISFSWNFAGCQSLPPLPDFL